jgi:hypothetical protein
MSIILHNFLTYYNPSTADQEWEMKAYSSVLS